MTFEMTAVLTLSIILAAVGGVLFAVCLRHHYRQGGIKNAAKWAAIYILEMLCGALISRVISWLFNR